MSNIYLSPACSAASIAYFAARTSSSGCSNLTALLTDGITAGSCVAPAGVATLADACAFAATTGLNSTNATSAATLCPLCDTLPQCSASLTLLLQEVASLSATGLACSSAPDVLTLSLMRDQTPVTCNVAAIASGAFDIYDDGFMSLAGLTQCTACGTRPCPRGLYCPGGTMLPAICPPGFYCPAPGIQKIRCPVNNYCTEFSTYPIPCRSSSSCPPGSSREVVWVPLFIALIMLAAAVLIFSGWWRSVWCFFTASTAVAATATARRKTGSGTSASAAARDLTSGSGTSASAAAREVVSPMPGSAARVSVVFRDLSLVTDGHVRLHPMSGVLRAGRLTAVMAGSGGGKTSLASCILAKEAPSSGGVTAVLQEPEGSGKETDVRLAYGCSMAAIRGATGYVPQVDVMLRDLTVREVVEHSAMTRVSTMSRAQRAAHVDTVLDYMQLQHIAHATIGDESTRGISGGERKRVNIAIELVAQPSILLADEPTSGLDSSSALRVIQLLSSASHERGLTCVCIVHQPRPEIVDAIDDLVLLVRGRLVYCGPMKHIQEYIESVLGYEKCSTAVMDWVADVLDGKHGMGRQMVEASAQRTAVTASSSSPSSSSGAAVDVSAHDLKNGAAAAATHNDVADAGLAIDTGVLAEAMSRCWVGTGELWAAEKEAADAIAEKSAGIALNGGHNVASRVTAFPSAHSIRRVAVPTTAGDISNGQPAPPETSSVAAVSTKPSPSYSYSSSTSTSVNSPPPHSYSSSSTAPSSLVNNDVFSLPVPPHDLLRSVSAPRPSFFVQWCAFAYRATLQHLAGSALLIDCFSLLLGGVVMGIVGCNSALWVPPPPSEYFDACPPSSARFCRFPLRWKLEPMTFYISITIGVLTIPPSVRSLGAEKEVFWREAGTGINRLAYFLGKVIGDIPKMILLAFFFIAPLVAIAHWRADVGELYFATLVTMFFVYMMGYCLASAFTSFDAANLFGVNLAVVANLFSGFVPMLGNQGSWCYTHWVQRSFLAIELGDGYQLDIDEFNNSVVDEHQNPAWRHDLWVLFLDALCTAALAFAILVLRHRDKQR